MGKASRRRRNGSKNSRKASLADRGWNEADARDFPIFARIREGRFKGGTYRAVIYMDGLTPEDMDGLAVEINKALQRCSVPEASVSEYERGINQDFMIVMNALDTRLRSLNNKGPMLRLLQNIISTPANLQSLLKMLDADSRSGVVRRYAMQYLFFVSRAIPEIWTTKLPDGASFAVIACEAIGTFLHQETIVVESTACYAIECRFYTWAMLGLETALSKFNRKPHKVIQHIASHNWSSILQRSDLPVMDRGYGNVHLGAVLFSCLHFTCARTLERDPDNPNAKDLLRKLGSCHHLFRCELLRITRGEQWVVAEIGNLAAGVRSAFGFLLNFCSCLVPLPADPVTDDLVKRAYASIREAAQVALEKDAPAPHSATWLLDYVENEDFALWDKLKTCSDEERWGIFCYFHCFRETSATNENFKRGRRYYAKNAASTRTWSNYQIMEGGDEGGVEMCAGCFTLEEQMEQRHLPFVCSGCRHVKYCSKICQRQHWKRAHKHQCHVALVDTQN